MQHASTGKLMHDMRTVVTDAEELLKATASQTGERVEKVRVRIQEASQAVEARAREAAREVDHRVHENPWTAIGVAAGVGLMVGILLGRR